MRRTRCGRGSRHCYALTLLCLALPPERLASQTVEGRVAVVGTDEPPSGAVVQLLGDELELIASGVADSTGFYRLTLPAAGVFYVQASFREHSSTLAEARSATGAAVVRTDIRISLPEPVLAEWLSEVRRAREVVPLDPVEVLVRSAELEARRAAPARAYVVAGPALEAATLRGTRLPDLLSGEFPVRVRYGSFSTIEHDLKPITCIESRRAMTRVQLPPARRPPWCEMLAVAIDGMLLDSPGDLLRNMRLDDFEAVEFLHPVEAMRRFGFPASSGAVVLWTVGRSPHR